MSSLYIDESNLCWSCLHRCRASSSETGHPPEAKALKKTDPPNFPQQPSTANSFWLVGRASYASPSTSLSECLLTRSYAGPVQAVTSAVSERHYGWSLSHLLALTVSMPHLPWCSLSLGGQDVTRMFRLGLKNCRSFLHFRTTWIWLHTIAYFQFNALIFF